MQVQILPRIVTTETDMSIQVRPIYDCKRASRRQLFGIYVDGLLQVICSTYPSWVTA